MGKFSGAYGPGTRCVRTSFIVCNLICMFLGAVTMAVGIYAIVKSTEFALITGSAFFSGAALLLICGVVTLVIACIGIVGGWAMWTPPLIIYGIIMLILIFVQFVSAILVFIVQDNIRDDIRDNLKEAIEDYVVSSNSPNYQSDVNNAVEGVQTTLHCCGVDNATDWITLNPTALADNMGNSTAGCGCKSGSNNCVQVNGTAAVNMTNKMFSFYAWEDGCLTVLEENQKVITLAIGVTAMSFAVIEIVLASMALGLCYCIKTA